MQKYLSIVFTVVLLFMVGLSVYLMIGPNPFMRAQVFSEQASVFVQADEREKAAQMGAQAIAINPYHMPFWSQLGYIASKHRLQTIELSSNVSRAAMARRFDAVRRLEGSAIGGAP